MRNSIIYITRNQVNSMILIIFLYIIEDNNICTITYIYIIVDGVEYGTLEDFNKSRVSGHFHHQF